MTEKRPFWNKKWGKNSICGITHSRLRPGKNKDGHPHCIFLRCGHGFYRKPLLIWLEKNKSCPLCRENLTEVKK